MKRLFPIWSRVAFVVLLPVTAYNAWDYAETRRYEARLAAIQQKGEPTTTAYLETGNWAQAERYYRAGGALLVSHALLLGVRVDVQKQAFKAVEKGEWTPEAIGLFRASVENNREALAFVDRGAAVPFGGFRAGTSYNYQSGDLFTLALLCEIRAVVSAADGDGDAAVASFAAEAGLVRALDLVPTGPLAPRPRFANLSTVLDRTKPSMAAREAAGRAFAAIDHDDRLRRSLLQYRVARLSGQPPWLYMPHPVAVRGLRRALDGYTALLAVADRPWPQRIDAMNALEAEPVYFAIREFTRVTADQVRRIRCARLLLSTNRLTLIDPFTGKPLEVGSCHL